MMDLADDEAGADVEAQRDGRLVRLRHVQAAQRRVAALVHDVAAAGMEEEGEVDAGQDEDDEAVHGDLAEQERPVVGEDVIEDVVGELRHAESVVDPTADGSGGAFGATARRSALTAPGARSSDCARSSGRRGASRTVASACVTREPRREQRRRRRSRRPCRRTPT